MNQLNKQYIGEYNYYCAMNKWRGSYVQYVKWRTLKNIALFK